MLPVTLVLQGFDLCATIEKNVTLKSYENKKWREERWKREREKERKKSGRKKERKERRVERKREKGQKEREKRKKMERRKRVVGIQKEQSNDTRVFEMTNEHPTIGKHSPLKIKIGITFGEL